jgi:hypothetical protein|tara:strand:+ start:1409 stop:2641 length:1233 start_codon:yes stop_codon:yes gene_type:complete
MALKDNFTNRYFKPDMVKSQVDMINQPTGKDAIAEGFQKYSQLPASNAYAELDNMTMSAIGDGMKSTANNKRQEQIDPILKMTGQINAQASYLEAQMQGEQEETAQVQQFVKSQSFAFSELAKASTSGDSTATNNIARGILQQYKNTSGDPIIGDFDHYHDGNIYYSNVETGEKGGLSVSQLISQSGEEGAQSLGADYPMIMSAFSTGFKGQYENTQELQRLELDKQQANINNTNAQTGLYGSQTQKTENDIANPKTDKKGIIDPVELKGFLDTASEQIEKIGEKGEQNLWDRLTSDNFSRLNEDQESIDAIGDLLRGKMFNAFGYRNETEFNHIPAISSKKTVGQNKSVIKQYENLYLKSQDIDGSNNNQNTQTEKQNEGLVVMTNQETGEEWDVPQDQVELFSKNGYR